MRDSFRQHARRDRHRHLAAGEPLSRTSDDRRKTTHLEARCDMMFPDLLRRELSRRCLTPHIEHFKHRALLGVASNANRSSLVTRKEYYFEIGKQHPDRTTYKGVGDASPVARLPVAIASHRTASPAALARPEQTADCCG